MYLSSALLSVAILFASASQQYPGFEWNKKSTFAADTRVEFPGLTLDPGTYIIRLRQTADRRSFVEILTKDESHVLATLTAIPDHRVRPEDGSEFAFHGTKRPESKVVQSWFYSGDLIGLEFVYPKVRAREIAKMSGSHVLASNGDKDPVIVAVTPNGKQVVVEGEITQTARQKPQ